MLIVYIINNSRLVKINYLDPEFVVIILLLLIVFKQFITCLKVKFTKQPAAAV